MGVLGRLRKGLVRIARQELGDLVDRVIDSVVEEQVESMSWAGPPDLRLVSDIDPDVPPGTKLVRDDVGWSVLGKSGEPLVTSLEIEEAVGEAWSIYHEFDHMDPEAQGDTERVDPPDLDAGPRSAS